MDTAELHSFSDNEILDQLSQEAKIILKEASNDINGEILKVGTMDGTQIQTNSQELIPDQHPRTIASWEEALNNLNNLNLINEKGKKGEIFRLTAKGFNSADDIKF